MLSVSLWILTFILILVSLFLILVVLAQKTKDGGMGATLGGGAVESTFGAEAGNVLTRMTKYAAILFFVLAFVLYVGRVYERNHGGRVDSGTALPNIAAPALPPAPTTSATPAPAPGVETPALPAGSTNIQAPSVPTTSAPAAPAPAPTAPAPDATKK
jgi:preprotein translocase subunit SecG